VFELCVLGEHFVDAEGLYQFGVVGCLCVLEGGG
jgi:hypothetical protein